MYPYAIINKRCKVGLVLDALRSFGYNVTCDWYVFKKYFHHNGQAVYIVLDSCDLFGNIEFFDENKINKAADRYLVKDVYEFLRLAADYKNCNEY